MCGFYCIAFIVCTIVGKILLDCSNLFSLNDYHKNDKILYKYCKDKYGKIKLSFDFRIKRKMKQKTIF